MAIKDFTFTKDETPADTLGKAALQTGIQPGDNGGAVYGLVVGPCMQVPLECFRKEEVHAFYRLTYAQEKTGKTYYNILPHLEIAQVFTIRPEVESALCQLFPHIRFYHNHSMILEKMGLMPSSGTPQLYVCFSKEELFLFSYKEGRLHYANTFPADVAENTAFFILSVWKGLDLDPLNATCILLGESGVKAAASAILGRYIKNVRCTPASEIFHRSAWARNPQIPFDLLALFAPVI